MFFVATLACSLARGHDLPMNSIMNSFVKIDSKQADLVVRVPLDLLRGVPFPQKGPYYDVAASGPTTELALLFLADGFVIQENGVPLTPIKSSGHLSPPTDRSFENFDSAVAAVDGPPDLVTPIAYDKGTLDVHFAYPISSPKSVFKIQTLVAADVGNGAKMTVRYLPLDDSSRAMIIDAGAEPAALNPAWYHAASGFVLLGIDHILTGIDHLLFLFCLVIPFARVRPLIAVITAFTVAHSVTLFASAFHFAPQGAWFPPFVEMAIAASIVYMAVENIVGANLRRRWQIAGMFGLVHGFGFSNALGQSLQFAGSHLLLSLFSFNVGIEIGQLGVLAITLPALALFRRLVPQRMGVLILSTIVSLIGGYWMIERWQVLRETEWPRFDAAALLTLARWTAILVIGVAAAGVLAKWVAQKFRSRAVSAETAIEPMERAP
jgi:hypothetical protein